MTPTLEQVRALAERCEPFRDTKPPTGYPNSLALCIIDSVQSTGVRYSSVENVIGKYRKYRRRLARDPDTDGARDLVSTFDDVGGPTAWAGRIGNQNKISTRAGAPLKAHAIYRAAQALVDQQVNTTQDLRDAANNPARLKDIQRSWLTVPGQKSGVTWHYVQMLAGIRGVKPDRMIIRFVADSLQLPRQRVSPQFAFDAVVAAAEAMDISPTDLDHGIWQWQRRRRAAQGPEGDMPSAIA